MTSVKIADLSKNLAAHLKAVEAGASIEITDEGRAIARIVPISRDVRSPAESGRAAEASDEGHEAPDFVDVTDEQRRLLKQLGVSPPKRPLHEIQNLPYEPKVWPFSTLELLLEERGQDRNR